MKGIKKVLNTIVGTSVLCMLAVGVSVAFAGCGSGKGETSQGRANAGSNGELVVFNWGEYIDPETIDEFEAETGIKVIYEEFETNEVMYAKLAQDPSSYDVICPSDYMISKMISQNMLEKLDFEKIPNATKNIGKEYYKESEGFDPGNLYSVPYCWGTVGILYNKTLVDDPITGWKDLWNEKYSGQILMQDSVRDSFMVAQNILGYSINTVDEKELNEAAEMLKKQYPLVDAYVIDQVRDKMINGEDAIGVIYSGEAIFTQRENQDLEYVIPEEGTNVWIDSWVIPKGSQNKENAYLWIDYICRGDVALKNFEYITYSTPNTAARDLLEDEDLKNSKTAFPDLSKYKLETYKYLGEEADAYYNELWMSIKSR